MEGVVLAACRQPNRRCGRGGAGARTAAESDGALSQLYVRLGLVLRPLLVWTCIGLRVACGAVCRGCNRVAADRLGWGRVRTYGAGCSYWRVWCSRLAGNQIGDAGAEALARALPPSLTALHLSGTCGWGLYCGRCWSGHALGCGWRVERCAEFATGWRRIGSDGGECARMVRGVRIGECGARGLQTTESEMRARRRWRAHCRRV